MEIRQLQRDDDRSQFDCGTEVLNSFLREYAVQNQTKRASVTFVAVEPEESVIRGYVTVCAGSLLSAELPSRLSRGLSRQPQPVLLVARLGVDARFRRQGIGSRLLVRAYLQGLAQAQASGCVGILVDAKTDSRTFYEDQGFVRLERSSPGETVPFFLPISAVEDALSAG